MSPVFMAFSILVGISWFYEHIPAAGCNMMQKPSVKESGGQDDPNVTAPFIK